MRKLKTAHAFIPAAVAALIACGAAVAAQEGGQRDYRRVTPPENYGNVVMDRAAQASKGVNPVVFSHWSHRGKYSCKVCHTELGFPLQSNSVEIKQADIDGGKFCGACHNDKTAFGPRNCDRCHSAPGAADMSAKKGLFDSTVKDLPKDHFGNMVNWVAASKDGRIKPAASLDAAAAPVTLDLDIEIPAKKFKPSPPDVLYPHRPHTEILDCSSCHTGIFQQKKGGNPDMSMMKIISGQYCGVCHGAVAFPLGDCFRCHSQPVPPMEKPKKPEDKKDEKPVEGAGEAK